MCGPQILDPPKKLVLVLCKTLAPVWSQSDKFGFFDLNLLPWFAVSNTVWKAAQNVEFMAQNSTKLVLKLGISLGDLKFWGHMIVELPFYTFAFAIVGPYRPLSVFWLPNCIFLGASYRAKVVATSPVMESYPIWTLNTAWEITICPVFMHVLIIDPGLLHLGSLQLLHLSRNTDSQINLPIF